MDRNEQGNARPAGRITPEGFEKQMKPKTDDAGRSEDRRASRHQSDTQDSIKRSARHAIEQRGRSAKSSSRKERNNRREY